VSTEARQRAEEKRARAEWGVEESEWGVLTARAEEARMHRDDVFAIRHGLRLCQLAGFDKARCAGMRAMVLLSIDAHEQAREVTP